MCADTHDGKKLSANLNGQNFVDRRAHADNMQIGHRLMRLLTTFSLLTICLTATGQTFDTESKYIDSTGKGVTIQNSFPKGGLRYTNPGGKNFVYAVFWTRVINETASPLELTINFPADSFPSPGSCLKLFLPPDTMTLDKVSLFNYGITDLESFLDTNFHKPTMLQRTSNPKEARLFCIVALSYMPYNGSVRAGLILKEQDLFYRINILDPALIPCGHIKLN